jgi:peptidoglycan L-alanyl-D-glutamate endopeptidase CwlK
MNLTDRDLNRLKGVHPDLIAVVVRAAEITAVPFTVLEGVRSAKRQKQMVAAGSSKTLKSRHLTGHAVDLAPLENNKPSWAWPLYYRLAPGVKTAAVEIGVEIEWGGDWTKFKDGPHWQLPWSSYPE